MRRASLLVIFCSFCVLLQAEELPSPTPAAAGTQIGSFDPAAATEAWLESVPPEQRARADAYFEGGYWLILWNFLMAVAIFLFLLGSGISVRLRDLSERLSRVKPVQIAFCAIGFILIVSILSFPLYAYEDFFRERAYGFATRTFSSWLAEQLVALFVQLVAGTVALVIIYSVIRRVTRAWWIWATGLAVLFLMIGNFLLPVFVEPLFNSYKPITDPKIRDPILAMARANEIPAKQVFEVDASRQTTRVSANVAGFLGTTRIALNDNLLKRCDLSEIRAVMGHEMGHYVLNHGAKLTVYFGLMALVGFGIARLAFDWATNRWRNQLGIRGIADPAALPLLALIFAVFAFAITPFINTAVRVTEREADAFGINASREPDGMARVALKLGEYRKLDPSPLEEFFFFDHPSGHARIRMAMDWKAANVSSKNHDSPEP